VISSSMKYNFILQSSLPGSSWISLSYRMKIPIPKSTLLSLFPPNIQQDQIDSRSIVNFNCASQSFSCSFFTESLPSTQSFTTPTSQEQQQIYDHV
ncbi:unnamed protein product, partial [Rotaria sp. Silwood1]